MVGCVFSVFNYAKSKHLYTMKTNIYTVCRGARAAKGGGLKILWHRPSRVRIPSPALYFS